MIEDLKATITGKFITQLKEQGITASNIHRNLPVKLLVDIVLEKNEGVLTSNGSLSVRTGKYTGRSPEDRYIVDDSETHVEVDWGKVNHSFSEYKFDKLYEKMKLMEPEVMPLSY